MESKKHATNSESEATVTDSDWNLCGSYKIPTGQQPHTAKQYYYYDMIADATDPSASRNFRPHVVALLHLTEHTTGAQETYHGELIIGD